MFTGKTAINMVSFEEVTGEEILSKIQELCKEYSVNFSKYVFLDSENVSVFTTDLPAVDIARYFCLATTKTSELCP